MIDFSMSDEVYFARPELSQSQCKTLLQPGGPAIFRWEQDHGRGEKKNWDIGHAAHLLALGKGDPVAVIPDGLLAKNGATSTAEAKAFIATARADHKIPLKRADYDQVKAMADQLLAHDRIAEVLTGPEITNEVAFVDELHGCPFRGKVDVLHSGGAFDYKSAASASPGGFAKHLVDFGYDIQAAAYIELMRLNGVCDEPTFEFIVQEKQAPYLVGVYRLDDDLIDYGRVRLARAISIYQSCVETGAWPGLPSATVTLHPPYWLARQLEDEAGGDVVDPIHEPSDFDASLAAFEQAVSFTNNLEEISA